MTRHGWLRQPQRVVNVADADFVAAEQRQNPKPRLVRQGFEDAFQPIDRVPFFRAGGSAHICVLTNVSRGSIFAKTNIQGATHGRDQGSGSTEIRSGRAAGSDRRAGQLWMRYLEWLWTRSDHLESLRRCPGRRNPDRSAAGVTGLWKPHRTRRTEGRRDRARPRVRRWHRRPAVGQACWADGEGVRTGYDRG